MVPVPCYHPFQGGYHVFWLGRVEHREDPDASGCGIGQAQRSRFAPVAFGVPGLSNSTMPSATRDAMSGFAVRLEQTDCIGCWFGVLSTPATAPATPAAPTTQHTLRLVVNEPIWHPRLPFLLYKRARLFL